MLLFFWLLSILNFQPIVHEDHKETLDSLIYTIEVRNMDEILSDFTVNNLYNSKYSSDPKQFISYLTGVLKNADKLNLNSYQIADIHFNIAHSLYILEDFALALEYIENQDVLPNTLMHSHYKFITAIIYGNEFGEITRSIEILLDIKDDFESLDNVFLIRLNSGLAYCYDLIHSLDKAKSYYEEGLRIAEAYPEYRESRLLYSNYLQFIYRNADTLSEEVDSSIINRYIQRIEKGNDIFFNLMGAALKLQFFRELEISQNDIEREIAKSEQQIRVIDQYHSNIIPVIIAEYYLAISDYYLSQTVPQYEKSLEFVKLAIEHTNNSKSPNYKLLVEATQRKAEIIKLKGDYKLAFDVQSSLDSLYYKYYNHNRALEITRLSHDFDFEKTILKNDILELRNNKLYSQLLSALILIVVSVVFLFWLFKLYISNNKLYKNLQTTALDLDMLNKELNSLNYENDQLIKRLNLSNQHLHQFASTVAHDLKSPLRTINGFISLIYYKYQTIMSAKHNEMVMFIKSDLRRLSHMVDDFLKFSHIASKGNITSNEIDLNLLVTDVIKNLQSEMVGKEIVFNIPRPLPIINSFNSLIFQLFLNIIGNSIKYSKNNTLNTITIKWKKTHSDIIQFTISDTGIGVEEKNLSSIFNLYKKVEGNTKTSVSSHGIGLATCQRIVNFLNGEIEIMSEYQKGTTITFSISANLDERMNT